VTLPGRFSRLCGLALAFLAAFSACSAEYYTNWAALHFSDIPSQSGPLWDPDFDGLSNLAEFAFGTDPRAGDNFPGMLIPRFGGASTAFGVEVFERAGHRPGVQIDLDLSADLVHWTRGWFQRSLTNSQPGDPVNSARELFSTFMPRTNSWFARAAVSLFESGPDVAKYYVATNGSDSNPGTNISQPFATLSKATGLANAGNLIYVRGGTYNWSAKVSFSRSGTAAQPIRVRAYPGELPVFNFAGEANGTRGMELTGNYWQLYGLEIANAGDNGIYITGKSNVVERCVAHGCQDTGIHIHTAGAYNLILNCDSYRNFDIATQGGNADGFSCKFSPGPGNVFRGCRSWENGDDGWDLWEADTTVVIENCWTFRNGFNYFGATNFAGNGNGFKLGGNYFFGPHQISHCVSFGNASHGYDQNNNNAGLMVDNNTGWANGKRNFNLNHGTNTTAHLVRNNLSIAGVQGDSFYSGTILTNNSWQVISSPSAGTNDLLSVDVSFALAPRRDDGGLPDAPFLRPVPAGRLVNKGVYRGEAFQGSSPDLGAFESPAW
jgi:hypothetical protein